MTHLYNSTKSQYMDHSKYCSLLTHLGTCAVTQQIKFTFTDAVFQKQPMINTRSQFV